MHYTATYSPEDNKLRLYASARLDKDTYTRARAHGFIWAPRQGLFVAPMWTPAREDFLLELVEDIGDEDTTLAQRQEQRAERFEVYQDKRAADAERAHGAVSAIADNIPLGQPILIGHHSEKHARKDAQRIENGMRKAVKMWNTSQYWKDRAASALHHAKYKELPAVRARRIKTIEAQRRKLIADFTPHKNAPTVMQERWNAKPGDAPEPHVLVGQGRARHFMPVAHIEATRAHNARWIEHCEHRLTYEKAMLGEQGASALLDKPKRATLPPILNYRQASFVLECRWRKGEFETLEQVEMSAAEFAKIHTDYKGTRPYNGHRVRIAMIRTPAAEWTARMPTRVVFLTDTKVHDKPAPQEPTPAPTPAAREPRPIPAPHVPRPADPAAAKFAALADSLRAGVQVVAAPQLFPTPDAIADKMVTLSKLRTGETVLEPSAGTGALLKAIRRAGIAAVTTAIEINGALADRLKLDFDDVRTRDFLSCNGDIGTFDAVLMNPPFENASDIKHIRHAFSKLNPNGRLIAICANGPRQQEAFRDSADHWEELPEGSFKASGTNVNTALLVLTAPPAPSASGLLF